MLPDKAGRMLLLYDFYGKLLTTKQQQVMHFYYEEDFSLGEIAQELQISRQAVHDTLRRSEHALEKYEKKLGLVEAYLDNKSP